MLKGRIPFKQVRYLYYLWSRKIMAYAKAWMTYGKRILIPQTMPFLRPLHEESTNPFKGFGSNGGPVPTSIDIYIFN